MMSIDSKNISISVIIPVHNEADVLEKSVASVRGQDYDGVVQIIAACNGCTDNSATRARELGVVVAESEQSGMGFGKNLGLTVSEGDIILFLDADSKLLPGALREIARAVACSGEKVVGTVRAYIEEPTAVERYVMCIANIAQYFRKLPTPSGAIFIDARTCSEIGGFDEKIPQGTSSDLVLRAVEAGAEWLFLWKARAMTSPRRFRRVGIVRQMFSWIRNVHLLKKNRVHELHQRDYENIR